VGELVQERLLSQERFVESYILARRQRGYGPVRIREELRQRGIGEDTIEQWLGAQDRAWVEDARQVRHKKFGASLPGNFTERAKQARFLQYRGFSTEQIQQVLNNRDTE